MLKRTSDMKPFNWPEASRSETHASGREIYPWAVKFQAFKAQVAARLGSQSDFFIKRHAVRYLIEAWRALCSVQSVYVMTGCLFFTSPPAVRHLEQHRIKWLLVFHVCARHHKCRVYHSILAAVHKSPDALHLMHISSLRHNVILLYSLCQGLMAFQRWDECLRLPLFTLDKRVKGRFLISHWWT